MAASESGDATCRLPCRPRRSHSGGMPDAQSLHARVQAFCDRFGLRLPILMAPMAAACPASLAIAVSRAGGMGACGALLMQPEAIAGWASEVRAGSNGPFQVNLWL